MKQNYLTHPFMLLFAGLLTITIINIGCASNAADKNAGISDNPLSIPALFERKGELAKTQEWQKTKEKAAELNQKIAKQSNDVKSRLQLATIFISEARITGEQNYYYPAIHHILDGIIALDNKNFEARVFKASVKMSQHQFAEAKVLAEKARTINPDNAYVYGVLVDANVELGQYEEAIAMSDKMQALKPSLESYSRASYLREIFGDYPGAINAMRMAVAAGIPGTESCEWARVALGDLFLNTGRLDSADYCYTYSLEVRKGFPTAEIGLAKVEKARKNYDAAIKHTENAIRTLSEGAYVSLLGDLYYLKGDKEKAKEIHSDVVRLLEKAQQENQNTTDAKHNGNRELAHAYLNAGQLDKAKKYAGDDLQLRPENIDANELVARIAWLTKDYDLAKISAEKMLHTHTMNPDYLYLAGLIYSKSGETVTGKQLIAKAKMIRQYLDEKLVMMAD